MSFRRTYGRQTRDSRFFNVAAVLPLGIAAVLLITLTADSAFAWTPPARLLRNWQPYALLSDLDAPSITTHAPVQLTAQAQPSVQQTDVDESATGNGSETIAGRSLNGASIQQGVEQPAPPGPVQSPSPTTVNRYLTVIEQTIEEAPVQQLVYAPVATTIIRSIQNITSNNIISVFQQCGNFCLQFVDIDALAIAIGNQTINGSATNNGTITQNGTFGSGSTAGSNAAQSLLSNPTSTTDIDAETNATSGNQFHLFQASGSGGLQTAGASLGSIALPASVITADSSNTASVTQVH